MTRRVLAIAALVAMVVVAVYETRHDWRYYQWRFRELVAERFGAEKAAAIPAGLDQIHVGALGRAEGIACFAVALVTDGSGT